MGDTTAVNITYKKINYGDQYSRFVVGGTKFQFTSKKVNYCKWRNYCKVYNSHTTYLFTIGKFIFNFTTTTELYSNPSLPGGCMECLLWVRGGDVPLGTSPELLEWESSCVEWPESVLVTEPRAKNISSLKFSGWPSYYRTVGKHHKKKKSGPKKVRGYFEAVYWPDVTVFLSGRLLREVTDEDSAFRSTLESSGVTTEL